VTKKEYDHKRHKRLKKRIYANNRRWQKANKKKWVEYAIKRCDKRHDLLAIIKNRPCLDCAGWFEPCQMDFDHRDESTKYKSVSALWGFKLKTIIKEIKKCDLVCANCHRLRTYRRNHHAV
jgi:hypothetical protein